MLTSRIVAISVCLATLALHGFAARGGLRVNETATRLSFEEGEAHVALVVVNDAGRQVSGRIKLDLVDSYGDVRAQGQIDQLLPPGATTAVCRLAFNFWTLTKDDQRRVLWYRLRYSISSGDAFRDAKASVNGIISISEITPDFFDLSVVAPMIAEQATRYHVRVRAAHPVSSEPISGVAVQAEITTDQPELPGPKASGVTNEHGYAVFDFDLPRCEKKCETRLKAVGSLDGLIQEVEREIQFDRTIRIALSTDKLIYQPGQTLHIRALALDPGRRAVPTKELTLKIEDPESTVLYRTTLKTSQFGIASADWPIPGNARLGDYRIRLLIDEEDEEEAYSPTIAVKISRYELPNFTVSAKSDRTFYLPGEDAEVEVRGDYLFGRPVPRGHVRLVRETSREWNYREQKWETKEEDKYEGELDGNDKFVARVDLAKEHTKLEEEKYDRTRDLTYAAYLTDATTGRTEQRRFDLRLTKEPIHVYCIEGRQGSADGEPVEFYVSTCYADGEPAVCDVKISQNINQRSHELRTVRTNRYGLAKISGLRLVNGPDPSLSVVARDRLGRVGHKTTDREYWPQSAIRIETNKTLYRAGQPIELTIAASQPGSCVIVDVARNRKLIRSQEVRLTNGKAQITLPYAGDFKDGLTIAAYMHRGGLRRGFEVAMRSVLYPRDRQLKLDVQMSRDEYRPGQEAVAELRVRTADGTPVESALGVSITDKAVHERTRTDTEFGPHNYFYQLFQGMWGDDQSLGGVTRASLDQLDMSKPVPSDLELVAEVLLRGSGYWPEESGGDGYASNLQNLFYLTTEGQLKPLKAALVARYARTGAYPRNAAMLRRELNEAGFSFDQMLDPWGSPYIATFSIQRDRDLLEIDSAGPDKRPGTADDFTAANLAWPYFNETGKAIDRAVWEHHRRTGDYIRDSTTLQRELRLQGVIFDSLRDRWGKPYRVSFDVERTKYLVSVRSGGENKRFEPDSKGASDDFILWTSSIDYSLDLRVRLSTALNDYFNATGTFPENDDQFDDALRSAGIERDSLRDPWGRRYYASFKTQSRYSDHVKLYSYAQYNDTPKQKTEITPVTQQVNFIYLRSAAEDGNVGTADDFDLVSFSRIVTERPRPNVAATPTPVQRPMAGGTGSITGHVADQSGAVIANATVKAQHIEAAQEYETKSDEGGAYLIDNLSPGSYLLRFEAHGFGALVIDSVPVHSSVATGVDGILSPSGASEMVMVTAGSEDVIQKQQSQIQISEVTQYRRSRIQVVTKSGGEQLSTPRLREHFPETLLWQPSIETGATGLAQLKFKLADNITTWKMSVVASTLDGEVRTMEQDIVAFQPFFIEHDPPRVLTEGDRIALPVILRNYLDKPQSVDLQLTPADWFRLLGPSTKRAQVPAGDAAREVFEFQAVSSVKEARQRITASGPEASDAIEKPVTVHPDGEEITRTAAQVIRDTSTIEIEIPSNAIHGSTAAELKIYPNLRAHVLESVEAILQRPYGCAEQTISAAYPGLLVLQSKKKGADVPAPLVEKADRYVRAGYERLLGYRIGDGAFSYWGRGGADFALTAYAVRFLTAASELVPIDEGVIREAREWLIKQQRADGSWPQFDWNQKEDRKRTLLLTAYIARVLSKALKVGGNNRDTQTEHANAALMRTLKYLSERVQEINEPYLIASYALAAASAGDDSEATSAAAKLRTLALNENTGSYWSLETNTPFYGWGLAGRIETTALAVQSLAAADKLEKTNANAPLIDSGLLFLLRQKDRYGVWYSTQSTINVLESLMTALERSGPGSAAGGPAEIIVNGQRAASIEVPASRELANPISLDLSRFVSPGANRVEIRRASGSSQASAQMVTTHWEPWPANPGRAEPGPLQLRVSYDKTETKIGDEVTCTVEAERVGFKGYGMMLAEIGLPPGADVDRASLDSAMRESDWSVQQYDVLPDRLVVYLWPRAGGVKFRFKLKLRYGLDAQTASSVLYDYYNPEARVVDRPTHFVVK
ncbi:MAG TPA: MG2 domain-containing protein [Blastocatellia bacterium]|nr:MG2 domain-containing protein [Blastocatellia bacterium]